MNYYIIIMMAYPFQLLLGACPEGTHVDASGCSVCPNGYYMDESEHTHDKCKKCQKINEFHKENIIVDQNCTAKTDLISHCIDNYFLQFEDSSSDREVQCLMCKNCTALNQHDILTCSGYDDTLCCESKEMEAHTDSQGRRKCVQATTTATATTTISSAVTLKFDLQITPNVKELIVKDDAQQELVCNIRTTDKDTKVKWYPENVFKTKRLDKTEVDADQKYLFQSTLVFTNFDAQHKGNYTCETSGMNAQSVTIFLDYITETKMDALFGFGNKTAELSCTIDHKYSSVVWLQNTTLISELKDKDKDRFFAQNTTLVIRDPERTDANKYIARFTLDTASQNKPETFDCEVLFLASPWVKDFEKSKNLIQEDNLELQCQVLGYPPAVVTWYKDNEPLNASGSDRVFIFPLKGYKNAHLKIKNVDFEDAGDYKCEAYSERFNDSSAKVVTVRVKDKLAALWPFLGIVGEVLVLCTIIFIYEKRRNKQAEQEESNAQEADEATSDKKDGLRHRNTTSNNTTA